jgi:Flp pilus assembly protein TadD
VRLARQFDVAGQSDKASAVLKKSLDANPSSRRLHYTLAKLLMNRAPDDGETIAYHLRRAFTEGDNNYEVQLLYGRQLFLNGRLEESKMLFRRLSEVRVPPQIKNNLLYVIEGRQFDGDSIYVHAKDVPEDTWNDLTLGTRVRFRIGFTFRGPGAFDLEII